MTHITLKWLITTVGVSIIVGTILMTFSIIRFAKVIILCVPEHDNPCVDLWLLMQVRFRFAGKTAGAVEQFIRLNLLVAMYWFLLIYPWAFRVYTRIVEGLKLFFLRCNARLFKPYWWFWCCR